MPGGVFLFDPTTSKAIGVASNPLPLTANAAQAAIGIGPQYSPYGSTSVSTEPSTLFFDTFDSLDVTNKWTAAGTVPPTASGGTLTASLAATANATSTLISKPTFVPTLGFVVFGQNVTLETVQQVNPNNYRFWGVGQVTSFAYATPVTDGAGFEVDGTGALNCVVWVGGVRYVINSTNTALITAQASLPAGGSSSTYGQTIAWQGPPRLYAIGFRGDAVFFYIGSLTIPVGVASSVVPNVNTLPYRMASINNSAGQLSTTFQASALGVGDTSGQNLTISDPSFQWRRAFVDAFGGLGITSYEKAKKTYSASTNVAAAAAATDIFTISGNATTVVYLTKIIISGIQTTAGLADVQLIKRSTADTGGTSGAVTAVPHDSADAAAAATLLAYTANPGALGTAVGTFRRGYLPVAGATSVVNPVVIFDFGDKGRPVTLRGVAEQIAVNLGGATLTGGTFDIVAEWFEV